MYITPHISDRCNSFDIVCLSVCLSVSLSWGILKAYVVSFQTSGQILKPVKVQITVVTNILLCPKGLFRSKVAELSFFGLRYQFDRREWEQVYVKSNLNIYLRSLRVCSLSVWLQVLWLCEYCSLNCVFDALHGSHVFTVSAGTKRDPCFIWYDEILAWRKCR